MKKLSYALGLGAASAATAFFISTGVSAASPKIDSLDTLGSSDGNTAEASHLTAEIHQAERNDSGNLLSVTWSISNSGNERVVLSWIKEKSYEYEGPYFSGVTATDPDGSTRYHPIMDGLGACLCSGNTSNRFTQRIEPGAQVAYWSLFSVPEDVDTVTVEIPGFEPIEDIPIS